MLRSLSTTCGKTFVLKIIFAVKILASTQLRKQGRNEKNGCPRLQYRSLFK
uniref:FAM161 centrosomal protein A n=1 Tax=Macaca fascicularis TaxID=9541 RepID=Q4R6A7_MACFA|nr:unnamed protein product [Macaca fascicularis]